MSKPKKKQGKKKNQAPDEINVGAIEKKCLKKL